MQWVHRHWLLLCGFNFNMHKWSGCKYEQTVCIGFKQCDIVRIQISQRTKTMQQNWQTIEMWWIYNVPLTSDDLFERESAPSPDGSQSVKLCSLNYENVDRRLQMLDKDYKIPERGKPSIFVGERQSSVLGLLKKSSSSGVINESLRKLRGLVIHGELEGFYIHYANILFQLNNK